MTEADRTRHLEDDVARLSGPDSALVDAFLETPAGKDTAASVARAALRLVTSYGAAEIQPWQRTVAALLAKERPAGIGTRRRLLRFLVSSPRRSLWSAVRSPRSLPGRMRRVLSAWAIGIVATAFLVVAALGIVAGAGKAADHLWVSLVGLLPLGLVTLGLIWVGLGLVTTGWHRWALRVIFTILVGAAVALCL
jgi:hypothetical protein